MRTLRVLPDFIAYALADSLVPILVFVTWCTRRKARRKQRGFYYNTAVVFRDEITRRQRRRLLWRWARHMTHFGIDLCKMPMITTDNMQDYCDLEDMKTFRAYFDRGNGLIVTASHHGVYEYSSHLISLNGMTIHTIFRESPIPPITDVINEIRSSGGQIMVERDGAVREMLRAMTRKHVLGIISDVSSKDSEVFAPYLGTMAATNATVGILHIRTRAPVLIISTHRTGRRRYKYHVWDVVEIEPTDDRDADVQQIAERINAAHSQATYQYPEQWFWDSRRFRTRPEGEEVGPDGLPPQVGGGQAAKMSRL